jgi:hypothetical protein
MILFGEKIVPGIPPAPFTFPNSKGVPNAGVPLHKSFPQKKTIRSKTNGFLFSDCVLSY